MKTVGIIGFGSFGKLAADIIDPHTEVKIYSPRSVVPDRWAASLSEVARADFVVLSIPLTAYSEFLPTLKPLLGQSSVVIDICSVKVRPMELLQELLPGQPLVATHPLFGPESAAKSVKGFTLVVCPESSDPEALETISEFARLQGIEVVRMTAEEHDQEMATVHGLTFFIAQSLVDMGLHSTRLATPSFKKLLQLAELEQHHSLELFQTIQAGNPKAAAVRHRFLEQSNRINTLIEDTNI